MASTQTDLIREVLRELEALDATSTVSTEDSAVVSALIAPVVADLVARRIVASIDLSAIPDAIFADLVVYLAERCAPRFGRPTNADVLAAAGGRLREIARLDQTVSSALVKAALARIEALGAGTDAVDAASVAAEIPHVLADLANRRVAVIANEAAVSAGQFPHVVTLVVGRMQPKALPPEMVLDAEARLASISRLDRGAPSALAQAVLGLLDTWGQGSFAVDATVVAARIPTMLANLAARNVICLVDEDEVDDFHLDPLSRYVAGWLAKKPMGDVIAQAEAELRTIARIQIGKARRLRVDPALRSRRHLGTIQLR